MRVKKKDIPKPKSVRNFGSMEPNANINVGNSSRLANMKDGAKGREVAIKPFPVIAKYMIYMYTG